MASRPEFGDKHATPAAEAPREEAEGPSLRELVDVARAGKWIILGCAGAGLAAGLAYAALAAPAYESHALIQVESSGSDVPGLDLDLGGWGEEATPAETEMEVLRSRRVLGQVVDDLGLRFRAEPRRFPVIGGYAARRHDGDEPAPARFGASRYGWGGERIAVEELERGGGMGSNFVLEAKEAGRYVLYDGEGEELTTGEVGALVTVASQNPGHDELSIRVSELEARPGTEFEITVRTWLSAIRWLRGALHIEEKGQGTGILDLRLEGRDPEELREILAAVAETYVNEHVDRRTADAQRSLAFLEDTLPELEEELNAAEEAFNEFRREEQAVDLAADTGHLLTRIVDVEAQLAELALRRAEHGERYTDEHPTMRMLAEKETRLRRTLRDLERRVEALPGHQQRAARLRREVEVAQELYTGLLNTKQELRIAKAGTTGSVRVLDDAVRPESAVHPRRRMMAALSGILGLFLGVGAVFGRRALRKTIEDPDAIERDLGVPLFGVVPHAPSEARGLRRARRRGAPLPLLAREHPQEVAVEGLRSLRTSLLFAMPPGENRVVAVTSPHPSSGKSFACMNAGYVFAETGKRVLVIDADLRRGYLHEYLGRGRSPGLAEVLAGEASAEEAVATYWAADGGERTGSGHGGGERPDSGHGGGERAGARLDVLTTGTLPRNPSEALLGGALESLLAELGARYDVILADTPPVLAVTDAAAVAARAAVTLMVVRGGRTEPGEAEAAIKRLRRSDIAVTGVVFNDCGAGSGGDAAGAPAYYKYEYASLRTK